jgi:DNA-nicking Smr family endonuclease
MIPPVEDAIPDVIDYEVTDSIDLHGFQPKDVAAVTRAYLEEARQKGFLIVRIVHAPRRQNKQLRCWPK